MELIDGHGIPYDIDPALEQLKTERESAVSELWENLYCNGSVGSASYAAVPELVRREELPLVAAIEVARHNPRNQPVPESLIVEYQLAINEALAYVPTDEEQLQAYYAIHASSNGQRRLAEALCILIIDDFLDEYTPDATSSGVQEHFAEMGWMRATIQ